jgi:hypothetical protein
MKIWPSNWTYFRKAWTQIGENNLREEIYLSTSSISYERGRKREGERGRRVILLFSFICFVLMSFLKEMQQVYFMN